MKFLLSLQYDCNAKCINGLIQSITAILMIVELSFETDSSLLYFSAHHFNQDPLENMFSKIRANGGFNRHPNAYQIGKIFSKIICLKLVFKSKFSNCENDEDITNEDFNQLINNCSTVHDVNFNSNTYEELNDTIENYENDNDDEINENVQITNSDFVESSAIDENALRYFLGFCLKKLKNCIDCSNYFEKQDTSELTASSECFIAQKNYNFENDDLLLRAPFDDIFKHSQKWAKVFHDQFFNNPHKSHIKSSIVDKINKMMEDDGVVFSHRDCSDIVINQFVVVLTRFNCNRNYELLQNKLLEDEKLINEKLKNEMYYFK